MLREGRQLVSDLLATSRACRQQVNDVTGEVAWKVVQWNLALSDASNRLVKKAISFKLL